MKPYYEEAGVVLYHADCREVLPELEPVDCCITDPPYGETQLKWDIRVDGWRPLLPTNQLWCCGSFRFFLEEAFTGWRHVQEIVWEKHNGSSFQADRFRRVHEYVVHFVKENVLWGECYKSPVYFYNGIDRHQATRKEQPPHLGKSKPTPQAISDKRLLRSVFHLHSMHGKAVHPTEKPVALFSPLIEYSCPAGGTVIDPFMGSGTAGVACRQLGRKFIGIDTSEKNCAITVDRLRQPILPFTPKLPTPAPHQDKLFAATQE